MLIGKMARRLIVALALSTASALVAPVPLASTARRQRPVVRDRVESNYRAPHAIFMMLSPELRRRDGVEFQAIDAPSSPRPRHSPIKIHAGPGVLRF